MKLMKNSNNGEIEIVKKPYVIIESLEQLVELIKDTKEDLIVSEDEIIIYDYYIE